MFTCSISGLSFEDSIFTSEYDFNFKCVHPVFNLDIKSLFTLANHALSNPHETSQYIIGLALLNSMGTQFNVSVDPKSHINIINNFQKLLVYSTAINKHPKPELFPKFIIDNNNNNLESLDGYLSSIKSVFEELEANAIILRRSKVLHELECQIDEMIRRSLSFKPKSVAKIMGSWATMAAQFPDKDFYKPDGTKLKLSEYWKELIEIAFVEDHMALVTSDTDLDDLADLIDYCEQFIPHGSTHAAILMSKLRRAFEMLREFRIVPTEEYKNKPVIVPDLIDIESILLDKPAQVFEIRTSNRPKRSDFKSTKDYLRAISQFSQTIVVKS